MAQGLRTILTVEEQAFAFALAADITKALLLDDLWLAAAEEPNRDTADAGAPVLNLAHELVEPFARARGLFERFQGELDDDGVELLRRLKIPRRHLPWIRVAMNEAGGLGSLAVRNAGRLQEYLPEEIASLSAKIAALEAGDFSLGGDFAPRTRFALLLTGLALLAVAMLPVIGAVVGAAEVAAGAFAGAEGLAGVLAGVGTTILLSGQQTAPPPAAP